MRMEGTTNFSSFVFIQIGYYLWTRKSPENKTLQLFFDLQNYKDVQSCNLKNIKNHQSLSTAKELFTCNNKTTTFLCNIFTCNCK